MGRAELLLLASTLAAALLRVAADGECGKVSCGMGSCAESGDYVFGFACQCKPGWSRYQGRSQRWGGCGWSPPTTLAPMAAPQAPLEILRRKKKKEEEKEGRRRRSKEEEEGEPPLCLHPGFPTGRYHIGELQFPFLPCVIPNCTINYNCQGGSSSPSPTPSPPPPASTNYSIFDPCLLQYCGDGGACERASDFAHRCRCRDGYANLLNDTSYPCYQQCSLGSDCRGLGIDVINGSTPSSSPPAPFSFTIKKSGARAAAAPADRLFELLLLISFVWLQTI